MPQDKTKDRSLETPSESAGRLLQSDNGNNPMRINGWLRLGPDRVLLKRFRGDKDLNDKTTLVAVMMLSVYSIWGVYTVKARAVWCQTGPL